MFKNANIYRIGALPAMADVEDAAAANTFAACFPTQQRSMGFVPARGIENGLFVELIAGAGILRVKTETRSVPAATLKKEVERRCAIVEDETGRKPGKKQRKEITENAEMDLLPQAFSKYGEVLIWIDAASKLLVLDTSNAALSDAILTLLVRTCEGWMLSAPVTTMASGPVMTAWLTDGCPECEEFDLGRDATLKSQDETKQQVVYTSSPLDTDEVKAYIRSGLAATKLGLTWKGRVSFRLTDSFGLRKIDPLDVTLDGGATGHLDAFDADVTIMTGELRPLIADLTAAHGGWVVPA